ncbi:Dicer dimerization domain [Rhizoctonia solani]|uniref:Dicer dimerization domain n=1 Tax=Rhizoctonia solani TaxID=456999 RepID=A0A8H7M7U9_9AGAM|nr:Dicer dimerization domain [Rhizoctonia solani]
MADSAITQVAVAEATGRFARWTPEVGNQIAVMLLKHIMSLRPADSNPKKASVAVFLVASVPLAEQQGDFLESQLPLHVNVRPVFLLLAGAYADGQKFYGAMGVDYWDRERWAKAFAESDVMVMTAQVFHDLLNHAHWSIDKVLLLVFDEAHHCNKNHVYAQIMRTHYHHCPVSERPRIFGMTASPIFNIRNPAQSLAQLQETMDAKPQEFVMECPPPSSDYSDYPRPTMWSVVSEFENLLFPDPDDLKDLTSRYKHALNELGPLAADYFAPTSRERVHCPRDWWGFKPVAGQTWSDLDNAYNEHLATIQERARGLDKSQMMSWLTPKLKILISILEANRADDFKLRDWVKAAALVGHGDGSRAGFEGSGMAHAAQRSTVRNFRSGSINLVIATSVAEEGLDFQACKLVVRLDAPQTMVGYLQSRGRARKHDSAYVVLTDPEGAKRYQEAQQDGEMDVEEEEDVDNERYVVKSTGAVVTPSTAIGLLHLWCSQLEVDRFTKPPAPEFHITGAQKPMTYPNAWTALFEGRANFSIRLRPGAMYGTLALRLDEPNIARWIPDPCCFSYGEQPARARAHHSQGRFFVKIKIHRGCLLEFASEEDKLARLEAMQRYSNCAIFWAITARKLPPRSTCLIAPLIGPEGLPDYDRMSNLATHAVKLSKEEWLNPELVGSLVMEAHRLGSTLYEFLGIKTGVDLSSCPISLEDGTKCRENAHETYRSYWEAATGTVKRGLALDIPEGDHWLELVSISKAQLQSHNGLYGLVKITGSEQPTAKPSQIVTHLIWPEYLQFQPILQSPLSRFLITGSMPTRRTWSPPASSTISETQDDSGEQDDSNEQKDDSNEQKENDSKGDRPRGRGGARASSGGTPPWHLRREVDVFARKSEITMLFAPVEEKLGYKFKNASLVAEAFTHTAYDLSQGPSYNRLEFLGDSLFDLYVVKFMYLKFPKMTPGQMSWARSRLVNASTFGKLAVGLELHKHILTSSANLQKAVASFAQEVEEISLEEILQICWKIDAPKAISDVFEAIFGAIYVDSSFNLELTFEHIHRVMANIMEYVTPVMQGTQLRSWFAGSRHRAAKPKGARYSASTNDTVETTVHGRTISRVTAATSKLARPMAAEQALNILTDETHDYALSKICSCPRAKLKRKASDPIILERCFRA